MQELLRRISDPGFDFVVAPQPMAFGSLSSSIRVKLVSDRAWPARRVARLLGDIVTVDKISGDRPEPLAVLILDCANFTVQIRSRLRRRARSHYPARVLWCLPTLPNRDDVAQAILDAVRLGWCHGFITGDSPAPTVLRAIVAVARHDIWLPRAMIAQALSEWQSNGASAAVPAGATRNVNGVLSRLTLRERQVLPLVGRGMTNKEIGRRLGIEEDTVKKHLRNIYFKLGVQRRAQILLRSFGEARAHG